MFAAVSAAVLMTVAVSVSPAAAGDLKLTIQNGRVTLLAEDVPLRVILDEWAKIGQTRIVNAEKLSSPSLTLQLVDVSEKQALDVLLRSAAGYMVAPRPGALAGASQFDRVLILATSTPVTAAAGSATRGPTPQPGGVMFPGNTDGTFEEQAAAGARQPSIMGSPVPGLVSPVSVTGGITEIRPPETNFNYANPPQLQQFQPYQQQGQTPAVGPAATPGVATNPGTTSSVPGVILSNAPQQPVFRNPYGLPNSVAPGSVTPAPQEPDRSKYDN